MTNRLDEHDGEGGLDVAQDGGSGSRQERQGDAVPDSLHLFLTDIARHALLSPAEEVRLAKRIEQGDEAALERMIVCNLRLVVSVARRYQGQGLPLADLVQEGVLGLHRAAVKFDWRRGFRFSTYATPWIRQAVQRGLGNHGRTIRLPVHLTELERSIQRVEQELTARFGETPDEERLAESVGVSAGRLRLVRTAGRVVASLDQPAHDTGGSPLGELIQDPHGEDGLDQDARVRAETVRGALARLPERERAVLERHYGLRGEARSLADIGREFGITRQRARQLEVSALERLAEMGAMDGIRDAA